MLDIFRSMLGISPANKEEIKEAIQNGAYLVDVRTKGEFQHATAKGAVHIPLMQLEANMNKFKNKKAIVLFCNTGNQSGYAQRLLESKGIENVYNGGSWQFVNQCLDNE